MRSNAENKMKEKIMMRRSMSSIINLYNVNSGVNSNIIEEKRDSRKHTWICEGRLRDNRRGLEFLGARCDNIISKQRDIENSVNCNTFFSEFSICKFGIITFAVFLLGFLVYFMPYSSALGVSPGRTTIDFEPSLQKTIDFVVFNSEHKNMQVLLSVKGTLKNYITLSKREENFLAGEESKSFSYTLNLPDSLTPGKQTAEIAILEVPELTEEEKAASVYASLAVITQLQVFVPYPGKYAEFEINSVSDNGRTLFILPVNNRGKFDIAKAKAIIDVYSGTNEKIQSLTTDEKEIKAGGVEELYASLDSALPGNYRAVATLVYDGETLQKEKTISVGQALIEVESIEIGDFSLGGIAKFNVLASNQWNQEIKDVSVQLILYDSKGEAVGNFKSANYDIPALSKKNLIAYWDTIGVIEGVYDTKLVIRYSGKEIEKRISVNVEKDRISVSGLTGFVVVNSKKGIINKDNLIIGGIILLVLINIGWFLVLRRRKKE
ncbi:MAG: hypothetical protein AABX65_03055 [Nanoarchaeota archaeon]